ncbi:MAG TPA: hydrogenase maturation nickel metallochaperone HypA [Bacteroidota bacterium]|nr:hydrogenase maturation nickel metallochaperone HypA [Bacteroidota bacterium]
MHELSIAQNILEIVAERLTADQREHVKSIKLRVGEQAGVVAESLQFGFHALTESTPLQASVLEIERVPFVVQCQKCGGQSTNDAGIFFCSLCNSDNVRMISGDELEVIAFEVFDEKEATI